MKTPRTMEERCIQRGSCEPVSRATPMAIPTTASRTRVGPVAVSVSFVPSWKALRSTVTNTAVV